MNKFKPLLVLLITSLLFLPGCELIKGVFQAGFWAAFLLIAAVIALIIWGISSFSGKRHGSITQDEKGRPFST